ncbi:SDR family oxidoreductase [Actinoplanes regularis]|uniref:NAD(P)-dependent dehydrogenase, short-chain alcohol dehydrogenase family n=1 Tax=Actinoplanes regularis TaxID=52697 RepID=A0A238Z635_9ACTN|nr:SDR family oxidoreductase [Actinoplanes regularis]GIE85866.1 short-chain dehydrogenase [Actinoplanes regularis]SNR78945.1 NAD(P)-dependent dehydrogenase, short-chain alcohol dehydrogenase family [Actinoplanes regularis]
MLTDKVVLIAGVGPGLGQAVAVRAAQHGADVVLAARTESYLTEVAGKVTAAGRRALVVPTDLTDDDSSTALVRAALDEFGRVDGLVNNAFVMPPMCSLGKVDLDDLRDSFDVNVLAALRLTRLLRPALIEAGGAVVMVNSAVLRHSRRPFGPYKLAKAGLLAVAQNLASELGPHGVRVNSVAPGWIWADSLRMWFDFQASQREVPPQQIYDEIAATTDLRRLPEPDEVADAVLFLLSGLARGITGQCLDVNCGEFHH